MAGWEFATIWETLADGLVNAPALVQGERVRSWAELDHRADAVASWLGSLAPAAQDRVAQYLHNSPEYLESVLATYKVGLVPVNTNYRYGVDELAYLWGNAEPVAVIVHGSFVELAEAVRPRVPSIRGWLVVDDGTSPCPSWATPYESVASVKVPRQRASWGRDGDQLCLLYTGGTTGLPKGVMWRQDDLVALMPRTGPFTFEPVPDYQSLARAIREPGQRAIAACPLMHGTALLTSQAVLSQGGSVTVLESRRFDEYEFLDVVAARHIESAIIVGDAFARPILAALDASPGRWDLSSLTVIGSSGAMWSEPVKRGLLAHHSAMLLVDAYGSSEALQLGTSISGGSSAAATANFALGERAVVVTDDGRTIAAGSGEVGLVAMGGRLPVGYFRDDAKTAVTFRVLGGRRYAVPGDLATVEADGSITLLGRGSGCINTGGEKVYAEEVEEALKTHRDVVDAVVVGLPDERWGEVVSALVELRAGATRPTGELVEHVKGQLAGYKAPRRLYVVESIGRAPNGKVDYRQARATALALASAPFGVDARSPVARSESTTA